MNLLIDKPCLFLIESCILTMDKILLIITDLNLRRLYHELLFDKQCEVCSVDSIAKAIAFMAIDNFCGVILFVDQQNEVVSFLELRRKKWREVKIILLTKDRDAYSKRLGAKDVILDPTESHEAIISKIKSGIMSGNEAD